MEVKVVSLISGGIDSPVSSYLMLRKGAEVVYLHFHSFPIVSKSSIYKVTQLVKILSNYQSPSTLYLAPIGEIQARLRTKVDPRYLVVMYRRIMLRIAERIAEKEKADALVTGESLGQVSSQTLQNLLVIEEAASIPVLRPLIGFDKEEIVEIAKRIGTYEISIRPQEDCCTLFVPKRQVSAAKLDKVKKLEEDLPIMEFVEEAVKKVEKKIIG
ncbi:MAG: 7-cyano-7-deazaguanine synthase [Thaumarchaeota archaeon]|nr:7-cyano-7-deazaguanine synthase [Nitrososphaerota archaeon]